MVPLWIPRQTWVGEWTLIERDLGVIENKKSTLLKKRSAVLPDGLAKAIR
jgi:hypothetical protein